MQTNQQAHPCEVAQEFMKRSDMKGGEVEAYAQTFNWLAKVLSGDLLVVLKKDLEASQAKQEKLETEIKDLNTELDDAYTRLGVERKDAGETPEEVEEEKIPVDVSTGGPHEEVEVEVEVPLNDTPDELDPVESEASD